MIHPFLVESIKPYKSMAILRISLYNNVLFRLVISGFPIVKVPCDVYPHTWCHFCLGSDSRIVGGQGLFQMQWYHQWTGVSFRFPPKSWLCLGRSTTLNPPSSEIFRPLFFNHQKTSTVWGPRTLDYPNRGRSSRGRRFGQQRDHGGGGPKRRKVPQRWRGVGESWKRGQSDGWFPP